MEKTERPAWLERKLKEMLVSGVLNLDGEHLQDLSMIPKTACCKGLILSFTPIKSFAGLSSLPKLEYLILDNSNIENFANISAISNVTKVSLYHTPVSRRANCRLSLVIACGMNLRVIDGKTVPERLREKAATYPPIAKKLIDKGWIATYPCPDDETFDQLCQEYGVDQQDNRKKAYTSTFVVEKDIDDVIAKYRRMHQKMLNQAEEALTADIDMPSTMQQPTFKKSVASVAEFDQTEVADEFVEEEEEEEFMMEGFNPNQLSYRVLEVLRNYGFEVQGGEDDIDAITDTIERIFSIVEGQVQAFPEIAKTESSGQEDQLSESAEDDDDTEEAATYTADAGRPGILMRPQTQSGASSARRVVFNAAPKAEEEETQNE